MNNTDFVREIKRNLIVRLKEQGLNAQVIAFEFGITHRQAKRYVSDPLNDDSLKLTLTSIAEICDKYEIDISELIPSETRKGEITDGDYDAKVTARRLRYELYKTKNIEQFLLENGLTKSNIYRVVNGQAKRGLSTQLLFTLCKALNVSSDYLIGLTDK